MGEHTAANPNDKPAHEPRANATDRPNKGSPKLLLLERPKLPSHPRAAPDRGSGRGDLDLTTEMAPSLHPVSGCPDGPEGPDMAVSMNIG
jgi:hypothetical protein